MTIDGDRDCCQLTVTPLSTSNKVLISRLCLGSFGAQLDECLRRPSILFYIVHKEEKNCECKAKILNLAKSCVCVCVCVFMVLMTTVVLSTRSQDLVMLVSVRRVHVALSTAGFEGGESRVVTHVKPPRCREASRRPSALSRIRTQAIGALARGCKYCCQFLKNTIITFLNQSMARL